MVQPDRRTAGVLVHHVATMYPLEIELAQALAAGKAVSGVTWDDVHALNARHADEYEAVTREEALKLLRRNSAAAAAAIRALGDEELDRAAPISLNADAPLTLVPDDSLSIRERAIASWPPAWHGQNLRTSSSPWVTTWTAPGASCRKRIATGSYIPSRRPRWCKPASCTCCAIRSTSSPGSIVERVYHGSQRAARQPVLFMLPATIGPAATSDSPRA